MKNDMAFAFTAAVTVAMIARLMTKKTTYMLMNNPLQNDFGEEGIDIIIDKEAEIPAEVRVRVWGEHLKHMDVPVTVMIRGKSRTYIRSLRFNRLSHEAILQIDPKEHCYTLFFRSESKHMPKAYLSVDCIANCVHA